jgi:transposase InsO family protein
MRYSFVQSEAKNHCIEKLCEAMNVSRSGYYEFLQRPESHRSQEGRRLSPIIQEIFDNNRQTYGYRRVKNELLERGEICGNHRVVSLMKKLKLKAVARRKYRVTTDSNHAYPVYENVLNRQFHPHKINESWTSDITYIATGEGWLYLAVVMDLYSRCIVGWSMNQKMTEDLVKDALRMALFRRKITSPLLLHSDRGSQYASLGYQELLADHKITCSMSRKGNCWDNAPMESFFRTLKIECVYRHAFKTRDEATLNIFDYIETFYNRQRKHSVLNYRSPINYELAMAN